MSKDDEQFIEISLAKRVPSLFMTGCQAVLIAVYIGIYQNLLAHYLIGVVGGVSVVLVYMLYRLYNNYCEIYNYMKVEELATLLEKRGMDEGTKDKILCLIDKGKTDDD